MTEKAQKQDDKAPNSDSNTLHIRNTVDLENYFYQRLAAIPTNESTKEQDIAQAKARNLYEEMVNSHRETVYDGVIKPKLVEHQKFVDGRSIGAKAKKAKQEKKDIESFNEFQKNNLNRVEGLEINKRLRLWKDCNRYLKSRLIQLAKEGKLTKYEVQFAQNQPNCTENQTSPIEKLNR